MPVAVGFNRGSDPVEPQCERLLGVVVGRVPSGDTHTSVSIHRGERRRFDRLVDPRRKVPCALAAAVGTGNSDRIVVLVDTLVAQSGSGRRQNSFVCRHGDLVVLARRPFDVFEGIGRHLVVRFNRILLAGDQ